MRFGEQRLLRHRGGLGRRVLFRTLGVADPAHYLHSEYLRKALDSLPDVSPRDILDVGCGSGDYSFYLARRFPRARVLGVDVDAALIAGARETAADLGLTNVSFAVQDVCTLDPAPRFDLIVAIDVLEHIQEQATALRLLASSMRPGGVSFMHLPTVRERPVPFSDRLGAFHEWGEREHVAEEQTADGFARAVRATGLRVDSVTPTFGYYTGELATSLFALPFARSRRNELLQAALAPVCRVLAAADTLRLEKTRYAVAVVARQPAAA